MCLHEKTCERSAHHGCPYHGFRLDCCFWFVSQPYVVHPVITFYCPIAILHALFPGLNLVSALCIAACLTPTDPVTCAVITRSSLSLSIPLPDPIFCLGGKFAVTHVPADIRQILSAESAANDGLAYPFLGIAIYLTVEASIGVAVEEWLLVDCVCRLVRAKVHLSFLIWLLVQIRLSWAPFLEPF